ncbi:arginine deiminase [Companilactobacillus sp. RD055328]|uniref:arginine deiminase n=1 Tax=Companilactobacillus sp. RD055328 TaxID=2916634 RepID=UPI001FC8C8DB|nr:arginine deiminase [Companilactobacillus sp. RD055328]GKQ42118.1 arginine deiminase [Companilactobacillus sp. RD055328]
MTSPIHVNSEIGKLKTVMLKRPGKEVENITPDIMYRLLFDDIPYLPTIQKEHDYFAKTLQDNGVEVVYLEDLSAEAIDAGNVKEEFLDKMLQESNIKSDSIREALKKYLFAMETQDMVEKIMAGVRTNEIDVKSKALIDVSADDEYPFFMDPMPNLYFTRDPAASMGDGLTINKMTYAARQRESMFMEVIMAHHPRFGNGEATVWRDRNHDDRMEGGDELVLNDKVLAIGISQRTSAQSIEELAVSLFKNKANFEKILAIKIPHNHAMMHLDTVFTMIDYDKFTIHPGIQGEGGNVDVYILENDGKDGVKISHRTDLQNVLKEALDEPELKLIPCGGGDAIVAPREQWNDGSNTLAIAPGVVVTYDRNYVSNELLRSEGIKVIEVLSSELSRGRGGPRCMSMPLVREDLNK